MSTSEEVYAAMKTQKYDFRPMVFPPPETRRITHLVMPNEMLVHVDTIHQLKVPYQSKILMWRLAGEKDWYGHSCESPEKAIALRDMIAQFVGAVKVALPVDPHAVGDMEGGR